MSMRKLSIVRDGDLQPPEEGPRLRVAIATQDGKTMNAHFGSARKFMVFEVTSSRSRFMEVACFDEVSDESGKHREDDRIGAKIAAIRGCNLLFVQAIGAAAASKVVSARIHPVKLAVPESVDGVIRKVQELMVGKPPAWLRRALASSQERSMKFLEEEDDS
jgi:nitrogen fixation protein NifX